MNIIVPASIAPREIGIRERKGGGFETFTGCCGDQLERSERGSSWQCGDCKEARVWTDRGWFFSTLHKGNIDRFRSWISVFTGLDYDDIEVTLS